MLLRILIFVSLLSSQLFAARDEAARFALQRDRFGMQNFIRQPGRDFYLDLAAEVTKDAQSFISDAQDVAESDDTTRIDNFITENLNTEHQAFAQVGLGILLPSFSLGETEWKPSLRASGQLGASLSVGAANLFSPAPGINVNNPLIQVFGMVDTKAGLHFNTEWDEHFYSNAYVYYNQRYDYSRQAQTSDLINDSEVLNVQDAPKNTITSIMSDLHVGYKNGNLDVVLGFEELQTAELSDKRDSVGTLNFGSNKPLVRLHTSYFLELPLIDLKPFAGVYKRSHYDAGDTIYAGTELFLGVLPLSGLAMIDSDYLTLSPRFRLWFLQIEGVLKQPLSSEIDGFESETFIGANLRFAF